MANEKLKGEAKNEALGIALFNVGLSFYKRGFYDSAFDCLIKALNGCTQNEKGQNQCLKFIDLSIDEILKDGNPRTISKESLDMYMNVLDEISNDKTIKIKKFILTNLSES